MEFVEDGVLMGVALRSPDGSVQLAARHNPARAAALAGFDPSPPVRTLSIGCADSTGSASRTAASSPATPAGVIAGLHDPDGIEVRLYTLEEHNLEGRR